MRPSDLATALACLYPTRRPTFVAGPPGSGKSMICQQAAKQLNIDYLDIRGVLHDPSDLKFPVVDLAKKEVHWINSLFPKDPGWTGIINLEELALCPPMMQGAFLQVTLDRCIGDYRLPDGAWIVSCGNRVEDRAGAQRLITPLLNRFIHLELEVSHEDWDAWALHNGVAPEVRSFLKFRPNLLFTFNPSSGKRAFATPRSWRFVSDIFPTTPPDLLLPLATGCVGEGEATEFVGFARIYRELPDINQVLSDPSGTSVPKEPSTIYALVGALVERTRNAGAKVLGAFSTYVTRMPSEYGTLAFRDALLINKALFNIPEAQGWLQKHYKALNAK